MRPTTSVNTSAISTPISSRYPTPGSSRYPSRASSPTRRQPFRFFDLPSEIRVRIYEEVLHVQQPLDLDPLNYRHILPRLSLLLVSHRTHAEAYPIFYAQPLRLFPTHGRFFSTRKPLLARLPPHYRAHIPALELRLGPGWSAPPACQNTRPTNTVLGLTDCVRLRTLNVFVECDPSDGVFAGFRGRNATEETYKHFCVALLAGIFAQVPRLETVVVDAWPAVKRDAPLVVALRRQVEEWGLRLAWGPYLRGREKERDGKEEEHGVRALEVGMSGLGLGEGAVVGRAVEVGA